MKYKNNRHKTLLKMMIPVPDSEIIKNATNQTIMVDINAFSNICISDFTTRYAPKNIPKQIINESHNTKKSIINSMKRLVCII
jgi:hypothetical protein